LHPVTTVTSARRSASAVRHWRWMFPALAGLALPVVLFLVLHRHTSPPALEPGAAVMDANAVMERVNADLWHTVPAPMEPILSLIPSVEIETKSGELQ